MSLGQLALGLVAASVVVAGCAATQQPPRARRMPAAEAENPMHAILASHRGLRDVVDAARQYRLQVVLGLVETGPDGQPVLVQHGFRLGAEYFYPASSVKLFAAAAALERLAELREQTGLAVTADTPLIYHPLFSGEQRVAGDSTNLDGGFITVRHEVRKIFLVSDNEAFNRLYELVGQDGLEASLARAGFPDARIVHRLDEPHTPEEDRRFPQIELVGEDFRHTLPERSSELLAPLPPIPGLEVGTAHIADGERIDEPFDMSSKNRVALADLQRALCTIVRPDVDCGAPGFRLDDADRALVVEALGQLSRESENPVYDPAEYPDAYAKFVLPGVARVLPPDRVRVYDKTGWAYGFSTENAYVVDEQTGRGFFLAATLYTNADGVLNDDEYEYDTVAVPFLENLGEAAARFVWDSP
ncbi:MAG: serine hydrolase [Thermoanaerobaculia bacterium]